MFGNETSSELNDDQFVDDEDDYEKYYPNEPDWGKMFPKFTAETYQPEMLRDAPDWEKLEPDDPLFLDMPWPEEKGPESSAFAKHMQWRRSLTDQERKQWQKWAVYQRVMMPDKFDYCLEDYIIQSIIRDSKKKAMAAASSSSAPSLSSSAYISSVSSSLDSPPPASSALWASIPHAYHLEEEEEIRALIGAYYSAFNRRNFDALRLLWLPDETVELTLPGYNPAIGHTAVDKLYKQCVHNAKPFGSVSHEIMNVITVGYVAIVYSIETVGKGTALQRTRKKRDVYDDSSDDEDENSSNNIKPKRVFTLFMLRKWNKQWRIMRQCSTVFKKSTFTGDDIDEDSTESKEKSAEEKLAELREKLGNLNTAERKILQKGVANAFKKIAQRDEGLFPTLPDEVREALEEGKTLSWSTQLDDEGAWLVDGNPVKSKGGKSNTNNKKTSEDFDPANRIITQNPDGSYTVNEKYRVDISDDDDDDDDEDDDDEDNDEESDYDETDNDEYKQNVYTVLEGDAEVPISLSRLTVEALRQLTHEGIITKEQKIFFLKRIVMGSRMDLEEDENECIDRPCDIEIAFEILVLRSINMEQNPLVRDEQGRITWNSEDLEEFADQCIHIWELMNYTDDEYKAEV